MDTSMDTVKSIELDNFQPQNNNFRPVDNKLSLQNIQNNGITDPQIHATPMKKIVAACSGAFLTSLFTTPFDVVKTRLQSQSLFTTSLTTCCSNAFVSTQNLRQEFLCQFNSPHTSNQVSTLSCAVADAATLSPNRQIAVNLNGSLDGMVKIFRHEGITSLWRGLSPALVMSVPVTVIYFVGYDYLRDSLWKNWKGKYSETYSPLIAGATARTISVSIVSPLELFRTRMQGPEGVNGLREVAKGVQKMVKINGVSSLWRGLEPSLYRDVPFSAIYWTGYELTKRYLNNHMRERDAYNNYVVSFLSGATSGSIAAMLTTPFDVAKTRQQISSSQMERPRIHRVLNQIFQEEGYKGLFRGGTLRISKVAISCAIMISTYETLSKMA